MKSKLLAATGLALLMAMPTALAQNGDEDVVVVTSTKREQTLQEVPIAVSVVDSETIKNSAIVNLFDIQSVVPSLRVSQLQSSGNTTFIIRGFGNGANNVGIEPNVAVYVDGIYRSRSTSALSDLPNIERVEVLRGPQSTLFGKNSAAGVISIVTQSPDDEFGGNVEATLGNFNERILRGYVTGPLAENLSFSLAGSRNTRDGYATNKTTGNDLNNRDRYAMRGQLLWTPTPDLSLRFIADYDKIDERCCSVGWIVQGPTVAVTRALGGTVSGQPNDLEATTDVDPTNKVLNGGYSLEAKWDLGWAELTSITSKREKRGDENIDADFTSLALLDRTSFRNDQDTFTQEFRLSGSMDKIDWLVGGLYFDEDVISNSRIEYGPAFSAYANGLSGGGYINTQNLLISLGVLPAGTAFGGDGQYLRTDFTQSNQSLSLFGQLDFAVTDRLTATFGISHTTDEKTVSVDSDSTMVFSSLNLVQIGNGIIAAQAFQQGFLDATGLQPTPANIALVEAGAPGTMAAIQAGAQAFANANDQNASVNPFLALAALQFLPPMLDFPNSAESGKTNDDNTSYTFRLAYDVSDRMNVYGSWATGFKASSWNLTRDSRPLARDVARLTAAGLMPNTTATALGQYSGTRFAGPEESEVFELGLKAKFDWGSLNMALFDQTIKGLQSNLFVGTGFVLANAAEQSVKGLEVDLLARPTDRLEFQIGATFVDAVYDSYENAPGPTGAPVDLSGEKVSGIHDITTSIAGTYYHPLENGMAFIRFDHRYANPVHTVDGLPKTLPKREINTFNASMGVNLDSGYEVMFWGRNIFQDKYITTIFPGVAAAGSFLGYPNIPRTYGLTLRKSF